MAERVLRLGRWLDRRILTRSPRVERALVAAAGVLFVVAAFVGFTNLPEGTRLERWDLLVIAGLVGGPATLFLLGMEYLVGGAAVGVKIPFREAIRISVMSSAANLLPLPGSALVRTWGLRRAGSSYRRALAVLVAVGLLWVGTAAAFAGALLWTRAILLSAILVLVGLGIVGAGYVLLRSLSPDRGVALASATIAVELGATAVGTTRIYLTVLALGIPISFPQAAALQLAAVVATASGIFPGGLGLREALSGAISPVVGLPASVGLVSATILRLLDKAVLLPVTFLLLIRGKRGEDGAPVDHAAAGNGQATAGAVTTSGRPED